MNHSRLLKHTLAGGVLLLTVLFVGFGLRPALLARAAATLEYGKPINGTLAGQQSAEYTFQGQTGDKLTISMNSVGGDIDPFLDLYDPQGKVIGEDDNGGGKDNALLNGIVLPADGTYKLVAKNKRNGQGKFSLLVHSEKTQGQPIYFDGGSVDKQAYQLSRPLDHTRVTYRVENTLQGFSAQDVKTVIRQAFQSWASVTPLTFQEVTSGNADLDIKFAPIDGPLNVLGETCPPSSPCHGQIQFDSEEPWTLGAPRGYQDISFLGVASHEFGHAIGLLHSSDANALMYPSYNPRNLQPGPDDIRGAQQLYGAGSGRVANPPTTNPSPNNGNTDSPQVTGTISDNQYVNYWDFDVNAGETVTITMHGTSGGLDSFLVLLDANNHILAFDDDNGGGRDAVLRNIRLPQSGTYTVAATRYQQAQGYTSGGYSLSINYGVTAAPSGPSVAATSANPVSGSAAVKVSAGQGTNLQQATSLDTTLDSPFEDSVQPTTQSRNATVQSGQTYSWPLTWCAHDAATLNRSLPNISVSFAVNGQAVDNNLVTRTSPHDAGNGLTCVDYYVMLSNWSPGQLTLTRKMTFSKPVFDGSTVYGAGDYIDQYTVTVQ